MKVPIIKGTLAGIISGSVTKFYFKETGKQAVISGGTTFGAVIITDTLFSLITHLPKWFEPLGYYGQDIASALIDSSIRFLARKQKMAWAHTNGGFISDFFVSLGSTVVAGYGATPLTGMIKGYMPSLPI